MKRAAPIALVLLLALALAGGTALAKTKKVASSVDIDGYNTQPQYSFVGNVYAKKAKCVRNREVTIFYTEEGAHDLVGTTTTDDTGDWTFPAGLLQVGDYVAEVAKKKVGQGDKKRVCKRAVSPTFEAVL